MRLLEFELIMIHVYVYDESVRRRDLEQALRKLGWRFLRHGAKHDVWIDSDGECTEAIPRHREINEKLARAILR